MNSQFLKDHLLDFEIVAALCIGALLKFGFDASWLVAVLSGLSAFVVIPLLLRFLFNMQALFRTKPITKQAIQMVEVETAAETAQADSDSGIVFAFSDFCGESTTRPDHFCDQSVLPYPRETIISAMEREIVRSPFKPYVDWLQNARVFLMNFLEGVGPDPTPFTAGLAEDGTSRFGNVDRDELRRILSSPEYKRETERSSYFWAIAESENKKVDERIAAAMQVRSARLAELSLTEKTAFDALENRGSPMAQFEIGMMYARGRIVPEDYGEAANWYARAAQAGHVKAQSLLGHLNEFGLGIPQNFGEAANWYGKAADAGDATAQTRLGFLCARGHGVQKDSAKAVGWWLRAAKQGNTEAQMLLGLAHASGEGVQKDYVQAYKWLSLAASQPGASKTEHGREANAPGQTS
jgi:hypothetical protein